VGTRQDRGRPRPLGRFDPRQLERLLEEADRLLGITAAVGDLAESLESVGAREVVSGASERLLVQRSGELVVV
jgi:hypothetical protein